MQLTVHNRGPEAAPLHLIPQLWARNIWTWDRGIAKPRLGADGDNAVSVEHPNLPPLRLVCDGAPELLFCDNESNAHRLWGFVRAGFPKDAVNDFVVAGDRAAVNPGRCGTKAAAHYRFSVPEGGQVRVRARLSGDGGGFGDFAAVMKRRRAEADEFYARAARGHRGCRGASRTAPSLCRHAVVEAVLLFRCSAVAARRSARAAAARLAPQSAQRRLAAPVQLRRHLDARQVGISLVRRLGPCLSLRRLGA